MLHRSRQQTEHLLEIKRVVVGQLMVNPDGLLLVGLGFVGAKFFYKSVKTGEVDGQIHSLGMVMTFNSETGHTETVVPPYFIPQQIQKRLVSPLTIIVPVSDDAIDHHLEESFIPFGI